MENDKIREELEEYKAQHGGFREGSGRPALGVTKKVSITLPEDVWSKIQKEIQQTNEKTQSAYLRNLILKHLEESAKGFTKI